MKLRLRTKFIGILVIAAVLPLGIALLIVQFVSYRVQMRSEGLLLETRASELARSIGFAVKAEVGNLHDWMALTDLRARVAALPATPEWSGPEAEQKLDARWAEIPVTEEPLKSILGNDIAAQLRAFETINPLFVELLVTNSQGELVGASEKSSDYWQADEVWWQRAVREEFHHAFVEGINYDNSAGVYSVDVSVPIRDWRQPDEPPIGVVKGVVNASPLLSSFAPTLAGDDARHLVVLGDGRILAQLSGGKIAPLTEKISTEAIAKLQRLRPGWTPVSVRGDDEDLVGFAPLNFDTGNSNDPGVSGLTPMFVLVYRPAQQALAPIRRQVLLLSGGGAVLILLCGFAGYLLAGRKIIDPLEALRSTAHAVGTMAKLDDKAPAREVSAVASLKRIRTGDEIQDLADEFRYMAGRILTYHENLERDLAAKTGEIERDLQMAREFQEALLPQHYPRVPSGTHPAAVALDFHHVYRPASSVGGDFFDVLKLSDHRAGVFVADVMGHGARSALVTAILRALLHNLAYGSDDPAQFLARLNTHFHEIVRESPDTIFVSAFYLIVDTETATATYASAGHPSPFVANRKTGQVVPLYDSLKGNPALGLLPGAVYQRWTQAVKAGDVFLLFTDGVHEAYNAEGQEFGLARLRRTIAAQFMDGGRELSQAILEAVQEFIAPAQPADDICLVTVDILAAAKTMRAPVSLDVVRKGTTEG